MTCKECGSCAVNPHCHGREPGVDLDLCDVCYWRKRAEALKAEIAELTESHNRATFIRHEQHTAALADVTHARDVLHDSYINHLREVEELRAQLAAAQAWR